MLNLFVFQFDENRSNQQATFYNNKIVPNNITLEYQSFRWYLRSILDSSALLPFG